METPEDKIVLDTILKVFTSNGKGYLYLERLAAAIAESYQKASSIGWETNALDALNDALRDVINKQ